MRTTAFVRRGQQSLDAGDVLTAFSIGLLISFSTCSGEAPGYRTAIGTMGGRTSGIASTPSFAYENRPSTVSATITIVANTG